VANFKDILREDENIIFFDTDEFAITITHKKENEEEFLNVIFDKSSEFIFENSNEFGESVVLVPSFLCNKESAYNISHVSIFLIEEEKFKMTHKKIESEMMRVFLEKIKK
jgi:hypothetical protein